MGHGAGGARCGESELQPRRESEEALRRVWLDASVEAAPNYARADNLFAAARSVLPAIGAKGATRWMGCRPSMPDSLPVLGSSPVHPSVYFAFGHGHLGLTGAAVTGRIIADLIAERPTEIDITPLRADRF